jgi:hypothetical protein
MKKCSFIPPEQISFVGLMSKPINNGKSQRNTKIAKSIRTLPLELNKRLLKGHQDTVNQRDLWMEKSVKCQKSAYQFGDMVLLQFFVVFVFDKTRV